jgi:hypothetical protein
MSPGSVSKAEAIRAIRFLTEYGFGVNLPEGVGALRFLVFCPIQI